MQGLLGKVALVTGGAKNIGKAITLRLAREGVAVVALGRDVESAAALLSEVKALGGRAEFVRCDVAKPEEIQASIARAVSAFGGLDIIVNNAAATHVIRSGDAHNVVDENPESFEYFMRVGLIAPFLFAKYGIPEMLKRGGGVIVNISSIVATKAQGGMVAYGPTKAALENLTYQIAVDYGAKGIRAVAIRVGMIRTDDNHLIHDHPVVGPLMRKSQMLSRSGLPEDIANAVAFVASDEGSFITGTVLPVEAGYGVMQTLPDVSAVFAEAKMAKR